jgi:flagellar biosynthetic protein FliR
MVAGEVIGNAMGLSFATMVDPMHGQQNPVLSQFLSIVATLLFVSVNGHLALTAIVVESYRALPPGDAWMSADSMNGLVLFGGVLFSAGLSIALPVTFAIIIVQLVMAMLARSAPQLNLFAVGFPAALLAGIVLLAIASPVIGEGILAAIDLGLEQSRQMATAR